MKKECSLSLPTDLSSSSSLTAEGDCRKIKRTKKRKQEKKDGNGKKNRSVYSFSLDIALSLSFLKAGREGPTR